MSRAEAERLLGVAQKLLQSRDLNGTKDFAVLAQETEPLLDGPDQILAVVDVLLASDKRIPCSSSGSATVPDWYSILQLPHRSDELELVKKQFRRLALLLHPDKNKFPFSGQAFQLVTDALFVLSDPTQKARYDADLGPGPGPGPFSKVDLPDPSPSTKLPVKRNPKPAKASSNSKPAKTKMLSFWTVCPYCYMLFEYPKAYENCCLKCQSCQKAFHGAVITSMPPIVPGKEAYYCTWGLFPLGFMFKGLEGKIEEFPGWTSPPMFANGMQQQGSWPEAARVQPPQPHPAVAAPSAAGAAGHSRGGGGSGPEAGKKKRGRPRKYPIQT